MHPSRKELVVHCDSETTTRHAHRIAGHLSHCEKCGDEVRTIQAERHELSARIAPAAIVTPEGLPDLLSAIAAWREGRSGAAAGRLRRRLRDQLETYCGTGAMAQLEQPGMTVAHLFGTTGEILEAFLGPREAAALQDEALHGLDWATSGETV